MKLLSIALLLVLSPVQARVVVSIAMSDPAAIEVSYKIPSTCAGLPFINERMDPAIATLQRKDWVAADACTLVDASQVRPAHAGCTTLRVRVPVSKDMVDRVYAPAFPLSQGIYAHTMAYAVKDSCGPVDWRFASPGGAIVIDGVVAGPSAARSAAAGGGTDMPVILLRTLPGAARLEMDPEFSPQGVAFVKETLSTVERQLRAVLPGLPLTMPFTVATVAEKGAVWGDVANQTVMRLHLPAEPEADDRVRLRGFLTHEMAHLAHARDGKWQAPWHADQALLDEGAAEFLRIAILARAGWAQPAELRHELESAVNTCVYTAAGARWHDIPKRHSGDGPYACGLAFHLIGLLGGKGDAAPLERLRQHIRKARQGHATDIGRALECGDTKGCAPLWWPRFGGAEAVQQVFLDYAAQPGSVLGPGQWTAETLDMARRRYLMQLASRDCQGGSHTSNKSDHFLIVSSARCSTLKTGMKIVRAEGLPLYGNALAVEASARSCAKSGKTRLGLQDGSNVVLVCDKSAFFPTHIFSVDIGRVLGAIR